MYDLPIWVLIFIVAASGTFFCWQVWCLHCMARAARLYVRSMKEKAKDTYRLVGPSLHCSSHAGYPARSMGQLLLAPPAHGPHSSKRDNVLSLTPKSACNFNQRLTRHSTPALTANCYA
jgi:hypothetical protein